MLIALAPPAPPGLAAQLPAAPARRQDSSGSSGSYHTAPGSPEPPDAGPDAEGRANWPRVAPALGAGEQLRLSISAQNSRQQPRRGSGFPRGGPGAGRRPPQPQLRMLPSGEMEVIFGAGALFGASDSADGEVQQLTARAPHGLSPPASPAPGAPKPQPQPQPPDDDGGSRWATYLELWPRGPSPAAPAQFECVEVALEERALPARSRTVPKRQIELRPRPRSPPREGERPRPHPLLRTGSLDESLGRLQAAAGLVQTALARKLSPAAAAAPAPGGAPFRPAERPEPETRNAARGTRTAPEEDGRARPPRLHAGSAPARAPRPWPSLRERAIRRDRPAPGTEPLGPVSSSIFLQSGEKQAQEALRNQELKTRFPGEAPERAVLRPFESREPWEAPSKAVRPGSPSPPGQAPNGTPQAGPCLHPQTPSPWSLAAPRRRSPSAPKEPSAWEEQDPAVEDTVGRRSPSPPTLSPPWDPGAAEARGASPEAPSPWEARHPGTLGATAAGNRSPSPPASSSREAPGRPPGPWSPSPQERWGPALQGSATASAQEARNGAVQGALAPPSPPAARTPELTEAPPSPAARDSQPLGRLPGPVDSDAPPEASGPGPAAPGRPRVAIPRPRDLRKMVKTTYAPSFAAGPPGSGLPAPSASAEPAEPRAEKEGGASQTPELPAPGPPAPPARYTSVYLKDFLPVMSHPYEPPEPPPPDTHPRDAAPQPNGAPRRRAENSTAKPFARTEIRLPGALAVGQGLKEPRGAPRRGPGAENRVVEAQRLASDGEGPTSPGGGALSLPPRPPVAPAGSPRSGPSRPGSPQAHPGSSPGRAPAAETPSPAPEPATAGPLPHPREPPALAGGTAPPQPRAASAPPPMDRSLEGPSPGARRPPGPANAGKVLVDPESGRYYLVEAPRQPRLRLLFDPESGQYVEVLLPPSPPGPPRRLYPPLALNAAGLYPPAYGPLPGLSLPPSPGPPAYSGAQLPWASEAGPLERMYYLPVSGTPSPAPPPPPLLFCAPPAGLGPAPSGKSSLFPA